MLSFQEAYGLAGLPREKRSPSKPYFSFVRQNSPLVRRDSIVNCEKDSRQKQDSVMQQKLKSSIRYSVDFAGQSKSLQGAKEILSQRSNRLTSAAVMLSCLQICCFKHKFLPGNTHTNELHITSMPLYDSE